MRSKYENGQSLVEFVLVLPLLLIILLGIIELSVAIHDKNVITNASREGARAGIVAMNPLNDNDIAGVVTTYCTNRLLSLSGANVPATSVDRSNGTNTGDLLRVTVTYDYGFMVLPEFVASLVSPLRMSATTTMGLE